MDCLKKSVGFRQSAFPSDADHVPLTFAAQQGLWELRSAIARLLIELIVHGAFTLGASPSKGSVCE
jgi:hypothetical protein